jgi:hypothetical protein
MSFDFSYHNFTACAVEGQGAVCQFPPEVAQAEFSYSSITNSSGASMSSASASSHAHFIFCWFSSNDITEGAGHALVVSHSGVLEFQYSRFIHDDDATLVFYDSPTTTFKVQGCQFSGKGPPTSYVSVEENVKQTTPSSFDYTYLETEPCAEVASPFVPETPLAASMSEVTVSMSAVTVSMSAVSASMSAVTASMSAVTASLSAVAQSTLPSQSPSHSQTVEALMSASAAAASSQAPESASVETTAEDYAETTQAGTDSASGGSLWWIGLVVPLSLAAVVALVLVLWKSFRVEYTYEEEEENEKGFDYPPRYGADDIAQSMLGHDFENPLNEDAQAIEIEVVDVYEPGNE